MQDTAGEMPCCEEGGGAPQKMSKNETSQRGVPEGGPRGGLLQSDIKKCDVSEGVRHCATSKNEMLCAEVEHCSLRSKNER